MFCQKSGLLKKSSILFFFFLNIIGLSANGHHEKSELELHVKEILSGYDSQSLNQDDALAIHAAFRNAGITGGPELDKIINDNGFDAEKLRILAPSPDTQNNKPREIKPSSGVVFSSLENDYGSEYFTLFSPAIDENGILLSQYKCEKKENGIEKSIPLNWKNVPDGTKSLAIIMYHFPEPEDHSNVNSYLLLWGIDPTIIEIPYGKADQGDWYMGSNKDGNAISYTSPCSQGPGSHKYTIALFALSETPGELPDYSTSKIDFESFMSAVEETTIIAKAELSFIDSDSNRTSQK